MEEYKALTEAMADPGVSTFKSGCPEQRRDDVGRNRPDEPCTRLRRPGCSRRERARPML